MLNAIQLDSRTKFVDGTKFKYWCKNQFKVETIGARNLLYCSKTSLPVMTKEETFDTIPHCHLRLVINRIPNWPNRNMNFQTLSGLCRSGICLAKSVADPEGVQGVRLNPPLRPNYFISMGIYLKSWVKPTKRTPLCKFEPALQEILDPPLQIGILIWPNLAIIKDSHLASADPESA